MAGIVLPHRTVVLASRLAWRPTGLVQHCPSCATRYDGPECPYCGVPAEDERVEHAVVGLVTPDGRRWVVSAVRHPGGAWAAERAWPCAGEPGAAS